jgi:polyisoprenoid-binding protein YceI
MKKLFPLLSLLMLLATMSSAQRLYTRNANVYFDATSKNSPEQIEAKSQSGTLVLDLATGRVESAVLLKGLLFEKALMQEHFNENYVESDKYPKASFKGKIENASSLNLKKDGEYKANLVGKMSLHGITKDVRYPATFTVKKGVVSANCSFVVVLADYDISVPSMVADKLNKNATVKIDATLQPM